MSTRFPVCALRSSVKSLSHPHQKARGQLGVHSNSKPVWPSGKALVGLAEGPRFDTASALLSLQKGCGLWTLSCAFVHHFLLKH